MNDLLRPTFVDQQTGRWREAKLAGALNMRVRRVALRILQVNLGQRVRELPWQLDGHFGFLVTIRHRTKPPDACLAEAKPFELGFGSAPGKLSGHLERSGRRICHAETLDVTIAGAIVFLPVSSGDGTGKSSPN